MSAPPWFVELRAFLEQAPSEPESDADFGGGVLGAPRALIETRSLEELRRVLDVGVRHRVPIAVRGSGHSSGGHTAVPGGIVLCHRPPAAELRWHGGAIEVPGHWRWSRVEQALEGSGRDLRVTTSSVETTVAGTLSVGGFGPRSVCFGPQVDQVRELRVICVNGEQLTCSPRQNRAHFFSALAGLGQVGIIEHVVLETTARKDHLSYVSARHASFGELAADLAWLADAALQAPDYFCTLAKDGLIESFCASSHASRSEAEQEPTWLARSPWRLEERRSIQAQDFDRSNRDMPLELWRGCRHLWSDYCFEWPAFERFAHFVDARLADTLRGQLAYVMCSAPRVGQQPSLDMRPPARGRLFSLGLFYSVPASDAGAVERAQRAQSSALDACLEMGGRPYVYGVWGGRAGLNRQQLERFFGHGYAQLRQVRDRVDPFGILNPNALN